MTSPPYGMYRKKSLSGCSWYIFLVTGRLRRWIAEHRVGAHRVVLCGSTSMCVVLMSHTFNTKHQKVTRQKPPNSMSILPTSKLSVKTGKSNHP